MEKNKNNYCVILAGGKGRRLWPCSRDSKPKQFVDFFGTGRTQLQSTFDRFAKIVPVENIIVCTNRDYEKFVHEQLPGVCGENIVVEPVNRNTAPCVAWANMKIGARCADARVIVTPSDQFVLNEDAFADNVVHGLDFVSKHSVLLAMGVKPTRPEPGYGYIQAGNASDSPGVYEVQSFTEKPEREFAKVFMESGEFYWNTGLFLSSSRRFTTCFEELFHEVQGWRDKASAVFTADEAMDFIRSNYASYPNVSIDSGILERSQGVCLMKCDFGWADLGTWHSIYECMHRNADDNVVISSKVMLEDCRDNVIKLPSGKLAVINGLDGYIVADDGDVLFICKKGDSSSLVRRYVNKVQMEYGEDFVWRVRSLRHWAGFRADAEDSLPQEAFCGRLRQRLFWS